jgi:hypothetical protein
MDQNSGIMGELEDKVMLWDNIKEKMITETEIATETEVAVEKYKK